MNDDNGKKLNITIPPEKEIIFGKKIIELKDLSKGIYSTNNLLDFAKFIGGEKIVFQNDFAIECYKPEDLDSVNNSIEPYAKCLLQRHPILSELLRRNNHPMSLLEFVAFLRALKGYCASNTISVLDNLNDLKIKKIISIVNKSDSRGNFAVGIVAESGKQDYKFPETITFNVPLLENNDEIIEISFDFQFTWKVEEQNAALEFRLINFEIESKIKEKVYLFVVEQLKNNSVFRGSFNLIKKTDEFKYKESNIQI